MYRGTSSTRPNYPLRCPRYHLIETIRPRIEVHWRLQAHSGFEDGGTILEAGRIEDTRLEARAVLQKEAAEGKVREQRRKATNLPRRVPGEAGVLLKTSACTRHVLGVKLQTLFFRLVLSSSLHPDSVVNNTSTRS